MKKHHKKLLCLFMVLAMTVSLGTTAFAAMPTEDNLDVATYYEGMTTEDLNNVSVLSIDYADIQNISETAKDIVDAGTMIYITNPAASAESVAETLSIPKSNISTYQSLVLTAYSIYKLNDQYVFANHYAVFGSENSATPQPNNVIEENNIPAEIEAPMTQPQSNFQDVTLLAEYLDEKTDSDPDIDPQDALPAAISSRNDAEVNINRISSTSVSNTDGIQPFSTTLPTEIATSTWNDTLNVYGLNNTYYGYLNCTVYAYGKGTGLVNGSNQKIYDVISVVKAYPQSGYKVQRYETQIHCNFTDFSCLQTTTIDSGTSYSQSLSLTGTYGSSGGSGGRTYTTGWSYNPESQEITESSSSSRIVNWRAEPADPESGKAYDIAPGMRVACPTKYMRGAFSKISCDAMILGITVNANEIEVGGWF